VHHVSAPRPDLILKPGQLEDFETLVKSINEFWLKNVKLPKSPQHAKSKYFRRKARTDSKT